MLPRTIRKRGSGLKAVEQGDAAAKCNLGVMHRDSLGVPQDSQKSMEWFTKAADQGDACAIRHLERCPERAKSENTD